MPLFWWKLLVMCFLMVWTGCMGNWEEYDHEVHLPGSIVAALLVHTHTPQYKQPENFSGFQEKDA